MVVMDILSLGLPWGKGEARHLGEGGAVVQGFLKSRPSSVEGSWRVIVTPITAPTILSTHTSASDPIVAHRHHT